MQLITSEFDKNDKSMEALTAQNTVLNKQIDQQVTKIATLQSALENASASFGENDRRTQNWQIQLNKAQAELNGMERELANNEKALEGVGDDFEASAKDADNFGDEVENSAGDAEKAGNQFEKLGSILKGVGAAMGAAFVAVGAAAVGAGKALTDMTVSASQYADDMLTMSSVTGMSTESLQAYNYAAELAVNVSMETLTASMSKNVKSMSSARSGTGAAADAYSTLGVAVTDSSGDLRDSETVYWEAIDALGEISNETERDAMAMQLFGKSARDLNPLIEQGSAGMAALTEEAKNMGAVMSDEALTALGQFDDAMQQLKSGGEAAKNTLGMVLLPQLQMLATDGVSLLGQFTTGLQEAGGDWTKISEVIGQTVSGIVDMIMKTLPNIIQLGMDVVTSIGQAIITNLPVLLDAASRIVLTLLNGLITALPTLTQGALQLVVSLAQGIIANLPALLEAAMQMVSTLVLGIAQALPTLIPAIVQAVVLMVQTLYENMPLILEAALQLMIGLAEGLLAAIPQLIEAMPAIINAIIDYLIKAIPLIIDAGIKLLTALVTALPTIINSIIAVIPKIIDSIIDAVIKAIPLIIDAGVRLLVSLIQNLPAIITTVVKAIPKIVSSLIDAIIGNIDKIILAGVQLFVSLIENLPIIIAEIVKAIPQIISGIVSAIGSLAYKIVQAGGDLIKGLWKGISDAGAWLWDKISGFFGGIVDGIKSFFGISSPSLLFADLGRNMGEGIGVGFEDIMSSVAKDMQKAIPTDFDVNPTLHGSAYTGTADAGSSYPTGAVVNQNIYITSPKPLSEKEAAREFKNLSRKLALGI